MSGRPWFYTFMGGVVSFAVAVGFGSTYAAPMARGTFAGPLAVHVHGVFALSWVALFVAQPLLVRWGRVRWHRGIGRAGLPVAIGIALTMLPAGVHQVTRDLPADPAAVSAMLGVLTSAAWFVGLVAAGIRARRDREAHARWLLLATLVVAWPAWFRFRHWFPDLPRPDVWFAVVLADVWIVVAMARDRVTRGAVHPVLAWAGTAVIAEQSLEVALFDTPTWRAAASAAYSALTALGL